MKRKRILSTVMLLGVMAATATMAQQAAYSAQGTDSDNSLLLEAGNHEVTLTAPLTFYDDGGADGKISPNINATYTFTPAEEGYAVTIDATQFSIGNGRIYVYSGREADPNAILGTVTGYGTTNGPKQLVSKAPDGSMTLTIKAPSGTTLQGFALDMGLHERVGFTLESLTADQLNTTAMRGSRDLPLMRIAMNVAGDLGSAALSGLTLDLAESTDPDDVTSMSLWYGNRSDAFSPAVATRIATAVPDGHSVVFDATIDPSDNGVRYLYVTADVADNAEAGNEIAAMLYSADFNGTPFDLPADLPIVATVKSGLKGNYTVGGEGADFATLKSAAEALAGGIEGAVTLEIADGTYAENMTIANVAGTSAQHPLIIRSKSGDRAGVVIKGAYSYSAKSAIMTIDNTPWVTIRDLSVEAGANAFEQGVLVRSGSHDVTLDNLYIQGNAPASGYSGINLVRTKADDKAGGNNDNFTISNCTLEGGYIGLYLGGTSYVALPKERGLKVIGNTLSGFYAKGVYVSTEARATVSGNRVSIAKGKKGVQGLDLYSLTEGADICGNRVLVTFNDEAIGMELRNGISGTADSPVRVYNNDIVSTAASSAYCYGMKLSNGSSDVEILFNTIRMTGTAGYAFATSSTGTNSRISMRNNLIQNETTVTNASGNALFFWNAGDADGYTIADNVLHTATGALIKNDKDLISGPDAVAGFLGNTTNSLLAAEFTSDTDSHPVNPAGLAIGTTPDWLTTDIEGNPRPATLPTAGAYQGAAAMPEPPVAAEGYPRIGSVAETSATILSKWNVDATEYILVREYAEGIVAPEAEVIIANGTLFSCTAAEENVAKITGLRQNTDYEACIVAVNAAGECSSVISTGIFHTLKTVEPLEVETDSDPVAILPGQQATLIAIAAGGEEPYEVVWTAQDGSEAGRGFEITVSPEHATRYIVTVSGADGQKVSARAAVEVRGGEMAVATFDDNLLPAESHAGAEDTTDFFYSGSYKFNNGGMPEYNFWYGYDLSNQTSIDFTGLDDQWHSAPGGGYRSSTFCVGFPQNMQIETLGAEEGEVVEGTYVTNSAYAINSMTFGDGFAHSFAAGDWFKLTAVGRHADGSTATADFYLADFRDEAAVEHYMVKDWEWMDLRHLGKITHLTFTLSSSDTGSYGMNTPAYLCLDNLGSSRDAGYAQIYVDSEGYDLRRHFEIADDGSRAEFILELPDGETLPLAIADGLLMLDHGSSRSAMQASGRALVGMRQKGHTQWMEFAVTADTTSLGLDAASAKGASIRFDGRTLSVTAEGESTLTLCTPDGRVVYAARIAGTAAVDCEELPAGVYIATVRGNAGCNSQRIMIR